MKTTIFLLFAVLAGCDRSDDRICGSLPARVPLGIADQPQQTASCVERWAARLAKAPDAASEVALAAVSGCEDAIKALETQDAEAGGRGVHYKNAMIKWRRRAHFIAVQTRAGNCYPDA